MCKLNWVVIKTLKGKVQGRSTERTIDPGGNGNRYVSAVQEKGFVFIYITGPLDAHTDQLTKLSLNGNIVMVYNDWTLTNARDIAATGDGHVFVCFPEQHCIKLNRPDMKAAIRVLDHSDGVQLAEAILYCSEEKRLPMGNSRSKDIMVFGIN